MNLAPVSDTQYYIQKGLDLVEELMLLQVEGYHPDLKAATELIISSGGKRIRPRIILLIGKLFKPDNESLVSVATAIEMLHTATLVHDDLIDNSFLRRGIPTLNSRWSPAATVLTGDFLFAAASDMASKTNSIEVMRLFSRTLMTIVNGEVNQFFMTKWNIRKNEYYHRIYQKTASLFETSALAAALISNANKMEMEHLRNYGYELGMAFQIIDDILDYVGNESIVGKTIGRDLRQGLITLPMHYFINLNPNDPSVQRLVAGNSIEEEDIKHFLETIPKSEAIKKSQEDAEGFAERAVTCLLNFPDTPDRDALVEITRSIVRQSN
jgi:geranylgeranyl pyrophosphate synthase